MSVGLLAATLVSTGASAQGVDPAVARGAALYERHCAACHGARMADPGGAANLRAFPRDQKVRFVSVVAKGRNNMPPLGDLLKPDDIDALWAYVVTGDR